MKSILFNTEMVQAILQGRKTQTRRILKDKYLLDSPDTADLRKLVVNTEGPGESSWASFWLNREEPPIARVVESPFGRIGDILWVRETFCKDFPDGKIRYKTDALCDLYGWEATFIEKGYKWKPSIHMPKEACRLFLKITNIRVERLQSITPKDAIAEGLKKLGNGEYKNYLQLKGFPLPDTWQNPYHSFQSLWEQINGTDNWGLNPWVWVVEFKQTAQPENFLQCHK